MYMSTYSLRSASPSIEGGRARSFSAHMRAQKHKLNLKHALGGGHVTPEIFGFKRSALKRIAAALYELLYTMPFQLKAVLETQDPTRLATAEFMVTAAAAARALQALRDAAAASSAQLADAMAAIKDEIDTEEASAETAEVEGGSRHAARSRRAKHPKHAKLRAALAGGMLNLLGSRTGGAGTSAASASSTAVVSQRKREDTTCKCMSLVLVLSTLAFALVALLGAAAAADLVVAEGRGLQNLRSSISKTADMLVWEPSVDARAPSYFETYKDVMPPMLQDVMKTSSAKVQEALAFETEAESRVTSDLNASQSVRAMHMRPYAMDEWAADLTTSTGARDSQTREVDRLTTAKNGAATALKEAEKAQERLRLANAALADVSELHESVNAGFSEFKGSESEELAQLLRMSAEELRAFDESMSKNLTAFGVLEQARATQVLQRQASEKLRSLCEGLSRNATLFGDDTKESADTTDESMIESCNALLDHIATHNTTLQNNIAHNGKLIRVTRATMDAFKDMDTAFSTRAYKRRGEWSSGSNAVDSLLFATDVPAGSLVLDMGSVIGKEEVQVSARASYNSRFASILRTELPRTTSDTDRQTLINAAALSTLSRIVDGFQTISDEASSAGDVKTLFELVTKDSDGAESLIKSYMSEVNGRTLGSASGNVINSIAAYRIDLRDANKFIRNREIASAAMQFRILGATNITEALQGALEAQQQDAVRVLDMAMPTTLQELQDAIPRFNGLAERAAENVRTLESAFDFANAELAAARSALSAQGRLVMEPLEADWTAATEALNGVLFVDAAEAARNAAASALESAQAVHNTMEIVVEFVTLQVNATQRRTEGAEILANRTSLLRAIKQLELGACVQIGWSAIQVVAMDTWTRFHVPESTFTTPYPWAWVTTAAGGLAGIGAAMLYFGSTRFKKSRALVAAQRATTIIQEHPMLKQHTRLGLTDPESSAITAAIVESNKRLFYGEYTSCQARPFISSESTKVDFFIQRNDSSSRKSAWVFRYDTVAKSQDDPVWHNEEAFKNHVITETNAFADEAPAHSHLKLVTSFDKIAICIEAYRKFLVDLDPSLKRK